MIVCAVTASEAVFQNCLLGSHGVYLGGLMGAIAQHPPRAALRHL